MIQKLQNTKVLIYEAVKPHLLSGTAVKWKQIKEIVNFPKQI